MASFAAKNRALVKGVVWMLGGYIVFRMLFRGDGGSLPKRIADSADPARLGLESTEQAISVETSGQWLMAIVQTVIGWIGSLLTVALVFAIVAVAVMLITDWAGKKR